MSDAVEVLKTTIEAENTQADASTNDTEGTQEAAVTPTPDEWYSGLPDDTKPLVEAYTTAKTETLSKALKAERDSRKALEKQVKELSSKAGKDTELSAKLEELSSTLAEERKQLTFYEAANNRDDLPRNRVAAAYKIAKVDNLIDDEGEVDWDAMRQAHDYLFVEVSKKIAGNAGNGAGTKPQPARNMNALIRGRV